jgi:hypothetical protein
VGKAAHQRAGFDGIVQILQALFLARIETLAQIDVEPGRDRAARFSWVRRLNFLPYSDFTYNSEELFPKR